MTFHFRPAALLGTLLLASVTGCLTMPSIPSYQVSREQYQSITSGLIGCPASEIAIANEQMSHVTTWEAECRGHQYFCSAAGRSMSCKEALQAPATAQQQP